jgi:quinol monooxygenase YgiN
MMKTKLLLLIVLMTLSFSCKQKTTVMDQQPQQNTVQPSDGQKMIIAKVSIKPENTADFIKAAQGIIKSSNEEEGCIEYQLFQSPYDQTSFVFVEKYVNQAAIDHHFGAPYFKEFGSTISGWTNGPAEIKIYDITGERMPE